MLIPEGKVAQGKFRRRKTLRLYLRIGRIWWVTDLTVHMNCVGQLQPPMVHPQLKPRICTFTLHIRVILMYVHPTTKKGEKMTQADRVK